MPLPPGKIYHAAAHPDLQKVRPQFAFVPDTLVKNGVLDTETYLAQRWASINAGANPNGIGSHTFPDLEKEADPTETVEFQKALQKLQHRRHGAPTGPRRPGHQGVQPEM